MSGNRNYNIDLTAYMAECDANYMRVMRLFPKLRERDDSAIGMAIAGHSAKVLINVAQRSRHTTVIRLRLSPESPWGVSPVFGVRLYHDLSCAEVIEYQRCRQFKPVYAYPNDDMRHPDEKAQVNRLLGEFLSCCLNHGVTMQEPALTT